MSIGYGSSTMSAIDPAGQLIELPMEQTGAYIMQDGATMLAPAQMQTAGAQAGKSLLKPELAQHLSQHVGYKPSVGRGGFTIGTADQRWMNMNAPRSARGLSRKPLGPNVGHMQPGSIVLSQSAALAPAASGLLSLGSRYTPSSAAAFGTSATTGNAIVTPTGSSTGLMSTGVPGMTVDRDQNYRLAAAIASGRGRPRGRRPLRGQFPVVPIDMVRQLGIEQQVILQPAAPVAMRNKAVLCRPLSMSRKTQASVNTFESGGPVDNTSMRNVEQDMDGLVLRKPVPKVEQLPLTYGVAIQTEVEEADIKDLATSLNQVERRKTLDVETSTKPQYSPMDADSQTDIELPDVEETQSVKLPKLIPIPIPVPIYVPIPVCVHARPVPFLLPFPLPCLLPLPVPLENIIEASADDHREEPLETSDAEEVTDQLPVPCEESPTESDGSDSDHVVEEVHPFASEPDSEVLVIASESETVEDNISLLKKSDRNLKRLAPSPEPEAELELTEDVVFRIPEVDQRSPTKAASSPDSCSPNPPVVPPPKRPRHALVVSDANYHLKFCYGINAWRHWVQQKLSVLATVNHDPNELNLKADLLNMEESDLNMALSRFVHEVRKPNNESYVADSIFYLCLGIQEYLNENGLTINIFSSPMFKDFIQSLNDILANFQPRVSPEGLLICRIEEEHLWEARQLGDQSPEVLLFTVLYLNTKYFGLRVGSAHRQLAFNNFQMLNADEPNASLLCHLPTSLFPGSDGSGNAVRLERNDSFPERCPLRLFTTYISRCPSDLHFSDELFYLMPNYARRHEDCWFSSDPVPADHLQASLNRIKMVKEIQEAFMNGQPDGGF